MTEGKAHQSRSRLYQGTYCIFGRGKINAWRPRSAFARDFVNFREKKFMHRARAARPRGFDSLPSLSDVGTFSFRRILPF